MFINLWFSHNQFLSELGAEKFINIRAFFLLYTNFLSQNFSQFSTKKKQIFSLKMSRKSLKYKTMRSDGNFLHEFYNYANILSLSLSLYKRCCVHPRCRKEVSFLSLLRWNKSQENEENVVKMFNLIGKS